MWKKVKGILQAMNYKINEIFFSLQGEGFNQGKKVVFIRLSGCNLKCKWCDTMHNSYKLLSLEEIYIEISKYNCKSVIITGGEPTIHDLEPLVKFLKQKQYWIGIESNGTNNIAYLSKYINYIAISPKSETRQLIANEVRIVNDNIDTNKLLDIEKKITAKEYYLSPVDIDGAMNIKETMELLGDINEISNTTWRISLQLHKFAGIE